LYAAFDLKKTREVAAMERLKKPEEYIDLFLAFKKGRVTAKDALRIEKKEEADLPGTGWYELHPFGLDLGTWNKQKDALQDVDIDAWNAQALERVSAIRAAGRNNILWICSLLSPPLLIAAWLQEDLSFGVSGIFLLVVAAFLWGQLVIAKLKAHRRP
jgi:hypothetical protein